MVSSELILPIMTAAATVAAAVAALLSWRTSRASAKIARDNALANHHREALFALTDELASLEAGVEGLERTAFDAMVSVPKALESIDNPSAGGENPKPIRHVVQEAAEIALAEISDPSQDLPSGGRGRRLLSPVQDGCAVRFDECEYRELLSIADGVYADYRSVFGEHFSPTDIAKSRAFRFCIFQMHKRLKVEEVRERLPSADIGAPRKSHLSDIVEQIERIKDGLKSARDRLRLVRSRTDSSAFPLSMDPHLKRRFTQTERALALLVEDIDVSYIRDHWSERADELVYCYFIQAEVYCLAVYATARRLLQCSRSE